MEERVEERGLAKDLQDKMKGSLEKIAQDRFQIMARQTMQMICFHCADFFRELAESFDE